MSTIQEVHQHLIDQPQYGTATIVAYARLYDTADGWTVGDTAQRTVRDDETVAQVIRQIVRPQVEFDLDLLRELVDDAVAYRVEDIEECGDCNDLTDKPCDDHRDDGAKADAYLALLAGIEGTDTP